MPQLAVSRSLAVAAAALGFAIGGFFDGILLHQVLQWHHLLSAVDGAAFADLRTQILADGLFHVAMYLVGAVGLTLFWRRRAELALSGAGSALAGLGVIGFGGWHALDAVLSHWILGIHRIRMDADVPLAWDVGWLVLFGVVPMLAGLRLLGRGAGGTGGGEPGGGGRRAAATLALVALVAGPVAALPPRDAAGAVVLFRPDVEPAAVMAAVAHLSGRVLWADTDSGVWALDFDRPGTAARLYGHGALLVGTTLLPAGCLSFTRPS